MFKNLLYNFYCMASAVQHAIGQKNQEIASMERAALNQMNAQDYRVADPETDRELMGIVKGIYNKAGITELPKVIVYQQRDPNAAFIHNGTVMVSTGLLKQLNKEEIEGVIAHEFGHQQQWLVNTGVRMGALVGLLVGANALTKQIMPDKRVSPRTDQSIYKRAMDYIRFEPKIHESQVSRTVRPWYSALLFITSAGIVGDVLKYPMAAFSRRQEYDADRRSAELTQNPQGLMSALDKLHMDYGLRKKNDIPSTDSMVQSHANYPDPKTLPPKVKPEETLQNQLKASRASHPEHSKRIARLREIDMQQQRAV